jgi:hypothetical protein
MANVESRFLFHAHAMALGGQLTRPCCEIIKTQGAVALPAIGGSGSVRIGPFSQRGISFREARSVVEGNTQKNPDGTTTYNTLTTVTIEGLNIHETVTADKVVARLTCEQSKRDADLPICPVGSYFVNLRIGDIPVKLRPKDHLCKAVGFAALGKGVASGQTMTSLFQHESEDGVRSLASAGLKPDGDDGCVIKVPGFGTVHIGEYLLTNGARRLTMLRLELGSPIGGDVEVGGVGGNGTFYP